MPPRLSYFICTGPRTGSTLLADTLYTTQLAGKPKEYFDENFDQRWVETLGITSESEYLEKVIEEGTTPNGVFGLKIFWFQLEYMIAKLARIYGSEVNDFRFLDEIFPELRFVFLIRRDKVRQAISYLKAAQTEMWWSIPEDPYNRTTPLQEPTFDFQEIDRWVQFLAEIDACWLRFFESRKVRPLTLAYEDFTEVPAPTIISVLDHLSIPIPPDLSPPAPRLKRQADSLNDEWVDRYHELKRAEAAS